MSFLPSSSSGFSMPYPYIALHAVSATSPPTAGTSQRSIYCQLEFPAQPAEGLTSEEDDDGELREMWIVPKNDKSGEWYWTLCKVYEAHMLTIISVLQSKSCSLPCLTVLRCTPPSLAETLMATKMEAIPLQALGPLEQDYRPMDNSTMLPRTAMTNSSRHLRCKTAMALR